MSNVNNIKQSKLGLVQRGFTLVEMMMVVVLLAIIVTLAYPSIDDMLHAMESRRVERTMTGALRQARVESYTGKHSLIICSTSQMADGSVLCDRGSQDRLVLIQDFNQNAIMDGRDEVVYTEDWQIKRGRISLHAGNRDYIRYYDTGKPRGHFGHLRYCSASANKRYSMRVVFNAQGRVRVVRGDREDLGC